MCDLSQGANVRPHGATDLAPYAETPGFRASTAGEGPGSVGPSLPRGHSVSRMELRREVRMKALSRFLKMTLRVGAPPMTALRRIHAIRSQHLHRVDPNWE